ncbi:MAG TPA: lysophospholipid acyltransferase family protein [Pseudonocardiaceae bacterium]|nr:lysophospholipid acyltransferase family protein [Pseudonocardiaceae bacterium]
MSWRPVSPCGPGCLPRPSPRPRYWTLVVVARLVALFAVVLAGVGLAAVLPLLSGSVRELSMRRWFAAVLAVLGVRLTRYGPARFGSGVLVVANHVSWLDVVAMGAVQPVRMLAKREVGDWPVVGVLVARAGTIFVDRDRLCGLPAVVAELAAALRAGAAVGVFPEGTTWCGASGGTFRPAVFQAALDAGAAVRPVALHYRLSDERATTGAAFLGTETLGSSLRRIARLRGMVVELNVLPLLRPGPGEGRRELARTTCRAVRKTLPATDSTTTLHRDSDRRRKAGAGLRSRDQSCWPLSAGTAVGPRPFLGRLAR